VVEAGKAMIPALSRVRVLRAWGGIMDMSMDGSPIIDRTGSTTSISMPAGAMADSRRRPLQDIASRIFLPVTHLIPPHGLPDGSFRARLHDR
jgi:glycine/D-amino acid oxidase-like deaminating enzyme